MKLPEFQETQGLPPEVDTLKHHALQLLVERERERMAFRRQTWWELSAVLAARREPPAPGFPARVTSLSERPQPPAAQTALPAVPRAQASVPLVDEASAVDLRHRLELASFQVVGRTVTPFELQPAPPLTTTTLLHEANTSLGWSPRQTLRAGTWLAENGFLTSVRTASTFLPAETAAAIRLVAKKLFGADHVARARRTFGTASDSSPDAPSAGAIRPIDVGQLASALRSRLFGAELLLYDLIWKHTLATQMTAAHGQRVTLTIEARLANEEAVRFTSDEQTIEHRSFLRAFDDRAAAAEAITPRLLDVTLGEVVDCRSLEASEHTSRPPARYTEASLSEDLAAATGSHAERCVNAIDDLVHEHHSCCLRGQELLPTWRAFATAHDTDDAIELAGGFLVRITAEGPRLEDADGRQMLLPPEETLAPDELTSTKCGELLARTERDKPLGQCPTTGLPVYVRAGRFGTYVQLGDVDNSTQTTRTVSLLAGMSRDTLTLATALQLLELPRILGPHPDHGLNITACNGRFGPYIASGPESRSLPPELSPLDVTLEQAIDLLKQAKLTEDDAHPSPKTLGESPVTQKPVVLRNGRFGPYVSDGVTNASIPKDADPESVSLQDALRLLEARAGSRRARPRSRRRSRLDL